MYTLTDYQRSILKERSGPDDLLLILCPYGCGYSYYDEGFTCSCEHCGREIAHCSDEAITLEDLWEAEAEWEHEDR